MEIIKTKFMNLKLKSTQFCVYTAIYWCSRNRVAWTQTLAEIGVDKGGKS